MCKELKLIIEVDGITHQYEETVLKDKLRQSKLEEAGFSVIRFIDDEVLQHINEVFNKIQEVIKILGLRR